MSEFAELDRALARAGAWMGASQAHGLLCGVLCTPGEASAETWVREALGELEPGDVLGEECGRLLRAMYVETLSQLNMEEAVFYAVLPSDDEPLDARTEALRDWCEGFILGLSIGGVSDFELLPDDSREIIRDIFEMTGMDVRPDPTEEQEAAYMEIVEYIRVGVLLVRAELVLSEPAPGVDTRLH